MHKIDASTMERYKKILSQDPQAQVFAPLAEGYRERGQLDEAEKVIRHGIKRHPHFPGGLVVFGKILKDQKKYDEARSTLEHVTKIDSENLLAYQTLGDLNLEQSRPKEALKYYKMVLFLNPQSVKAQKVVQKLESLSADEYDDEIFEMAPLKAVKNPLYAAPIEAAKTNAALGAPAFPSAPRGLQRMMSLVDAFIVRNDLAKAQYLLTETEVEFGEHAEINQRRKLLYNRQSSQLSKEDDEIENIAPVLTRETAIRRKKLALLESVLRVIGQAQP
jgi:tetratricopeptide (TPR) repeat protein